MMQPLPTKYVDIKGTTHTNKVTAALTNSSRFFVLEPLPDDFYRIYVKEESFAHLKATVEVTKKEYVECKICGAGVPVDDAYRHYPGYVCEDCWDERLRTTS